MYSAQFLHTAHYPLAYRRQRGAAPTVMFLSGFKSDMTGSKASALATHCAERGRSFLRFDYSGHGQSGGDFLEGSISQWKQDALTMLDQCTDGPVVLVGSSMGGWLALLLAIERPQRVAAMVGVAAAPDFTERLIWDALSPMQKAQLLRTGILYAPSCSGEPPYPITLRLIADGRNHLLLDTTIAVRCPVHLLHGTHDQDVPLAMAERLHARLPQSQLTRIEGGDHRLSAPDHLALLCKTVDAQNTACENMAGR